MSLTVFVIEAVACMVVAYLILGDKQSKAKRCDHVWVLIRLSAHMAGDTLRIGVWQCAGCKSRRATAVPIDSNEWVQAPEKRAA